MTTLIPLGIPVYFPHIAHVGMVNEHTNKMGFSLALGVSCQQHGGSRTSLYQLNGKKRVLLNAGKLHHRILGGRFLPQTLLLS